MILAKNPPPCQDRSGCFGTRYEACKSAPIQSTDQRQSRDSAAPEDAKKTGVKHQVELLANERLSPLQIMRPVALWLRPGLGPGCRSCDGQQDPRVRQAREGQSSPNYGRFVVYRRCGLPPARSHSDYPLRYRIGPPLGPMPALQLYKKLLTRKVAYSYSFASSERWSLVIYSRSMLPTPDIARNKKVVPYPSGRSRRTVAG
jgi:hypothetical protein